MEKNEDSVESEEDSSELLEELLLVLQKQSSMLAACLSLILLLVGHSPSYSDLSTFLGHSTTPVFEKILSETNAIFARYSANLESATTSQETQQYGQQLQKGTQPDNLEQE